MKRAFNFLIVSTIAVMLAFSSGTHSHATDYYWIGGSGSWSEPSSWSPYGVPVPYDSVFLVTSDASDRTIIYDIGPGHNPYAGLTLGSTGAGTTTLSVSDGNLVTVGGDFTVGNKGIINQSGGTVGSPMGSDSIISTGGLYNLTAGTLGAILLNVMGTLNQSGGEVVTDMGMNVNGGTYNMTGGTFAGPWNFSWDISNQGVFNQSGGTVRIDVQLSIIGGGTYNMDTGQLSVGQGYHTPGLSLNDGAFNQRGGSASFQGMEIGKMGTYNLSGGNLDTDNLGLFNNSSGFQNAGIFNYSGGSFSTTLPFMNDGTTKLSGNGIRVIGSDVVNNGTFKIAPNTIGKINGRYTQNDTGLLSLYLFDDTNYGRLITGDAFLDGILDVLFIPGGDIHVNDTFLIMSYLNRYGFFSAINLFDPDGAGPLYFDYAYLTDGLLLTVKTPEPATMLLVGFGLVGLASIRKRFRD